MFTGIIDHCGELKRVEVNAQGCQLFIETNYNDLKLGESIAVDGICLTVCEIAGGQFRCDLSQETLAVTTAQQFEVGQTLNLERALQLGDRFGGHIVLGHVDNTATVTSMKQVGEATEIQFANLPSTAQNFLIPKGSITVNGVSLTINAVNEKCFTVMLIPHTLSITTLSTLTPQPPPQD